VAELGVRPMRALIASIIFIVSLSAVLLASETNWREFFAPNKHYAVRMQEGYAIGNCRYNHAQLIEIKNGKLLYDFGPEHSPSFDLGGYDQDSVVWSPDSRYVALYFHSHRVGEPLVVAISKGKALECTVPEITLPHDKDPANDGRHVSDWLKPVKWFSDSTLCLTDSGIIQQQREDGFRIEYEYEIHIQFDQAGHGTLRSIKQLEFLKK